MPLTLDAPLLTELPRLGGGGGGLGGSWRIVVLNDDHNSFDSVAEALSQTLPEVSLADGYRFADTIHNAGQAIVWTGNKEEGQGYWERLAELGLTLAPLEQS